jgi:two-component system sensor histidine kinase/response regulator
LNVNAPGNILTVDDDQANLKMLVSILSQQGHKVRAVTSGQMGLTAARAAPPELILLDVNLPDLNGYEVCCQLKSDVTLRQIPVIFISAMDETLDKVEAFHSGGVDYITKPYQAEEVLVRVENHLNLYRLHLRSQEMAKLEERQRIARDLHDAVNQTIFSASMMAETLLLSSMDDTTREGLERIYQLAQGALAELRMLLIELRPEALDKTALGDLLHHLSKAVTARTRAEIDFHIDLDIALDADVKTTFYRVAQEALNNILKHARASHVAISLRRSDGEVTLRISDNGCGLDVNTLPTDHFGLGIMAERAELVGASLDVISAEGRGTDVILTYRE